jgi:hypothetical protein
VFDTLSPRGQEFTGSRVPYLLSLLDKQRANAREKRTIKYLGTTFLKITCMIHAVPPESSSAIVEDGWSCRFGGGDWELPMAKAVLSIAAGAIVAALLTGSAVAQSMNMPLGGTKTLSDDEKAQKAEQERAYKAAIGKIPDQKANTDPWGNVRGAGTPQANQNQSRTNSNSK